MTRFRIGVRLRPVYYTHVDVEAGSFGEALTKFKALRPDEIDFDQLEECLAHDGLGFGYLDPERGEIEAVDMYHPDTQEYRSVVDGVITAAD